MKMSSVIVNSSLPPDILLVIWLYLNVLCCSSMPMFSTGLKYPLQPRRKREASALLCLCYQNWDLMPSQALFVR